MLMPSVAPNRRTTRARRSGLRVRAGRGHPATRRPIIRFARWLRTEYDFPIQVPVYLLPGPMFLTIDQEDAVASFFAPWKRTVEPYIRRATGDYPCLRAELGRDDALASILHSFANQVLRYQEWVHTGKLSKRPMSREATLMLRRYSATVSHP